MACVLADALTRESLWWAVDARGTCATTGKPMGCHWTVHGREIGQEAAIDGDDVRFAAELHGTGPIERLEVIHNGQVVWWSRLERWT